MSIARLTPRTQMALAVAASLCCLGLCLLLLRPPVSGLRAVARELADTEKTIQQKQLVISQAEATASEGLLALAVAGADEQEPIRFLRQLAALTAESGTTLVAVRALKLPPPPGAATGSPPGQPPSGPSANATVSGQRPVVPDTVTELTDEVTVQGTFGAILSLLVRLENFERILSVSKCRITSGGSVGYPRLQAVFTLSRFVVPPESGGSVSPAQPTAEP